MYVGKGERLWPYISSDEVLSVIQGPCALVSSRLLIHYTVFLSIRLVQPFISKTQEFQGVPQTSHVWTHPLHGCLS